MYRFYEEIDKQKIYLGSSIEEANAKQIAFEMNVWRSILVILQQNMGNSTLTSTEAVLTFLNQALQGAPSRMGSIANVQYEYWPDDPGEAAAHSIWTTLQNPVPVMLGAQYICRNCGGTISDCGCEDSSLDLIPL